MLVLSCSVPSDSATPWTVTHQASLSTGFSRQEYWSGLPCLSPYKGLCDRITEWLPGGPNGLGQLPDVPSLQAESKQDSSVSLFTQRNSTDLGQPLIPDNNSDFPNAIAIQRPTEPILKTQKSNRRMVNSFSRCHTC